MLQAKAPKLALLLLLSCAAICRFSIDSAFAQAADVSFKGKTISIMVGFGPGGGYDIYARLVAAHLGRFLPGTPNVVVQNAPGSASVKAAMILSNVSPKDGSALGLFLSALTVNDVLGRTTRVHPERFVWIGRVNESATLGLVWHKSTIQSMTRAMEAELIVGSTGVSGNSAMVPWALNAFIGTKFKVIPGYTSSPALAMALEQGEINGIGAISLEYLQTTKPDWLKEGKVKILYVIDAKRKTLFPEAPAIVEFAKHDDARQVLKLLSSASTIGYSFAAPPGTRKEAAAALEKAFSQMVGDSGFLSDAATRRLDISPLSGAEVQRIVADAVGTAPEVVEKAKRATMPP